MTRRLTLKEKIQKCLFTTYHRRLFELCNKNPELDHLYRELSKSTNTPQYNELMERFRKIVLADPEIKEVAEMQRRFKDE